MIRVGVFICRYVKTYCKTEEIQRKMECRLVVTPHHQRPNKSVTLLHGALRVGEKQS